MATTLFLVRHGSHALLGRVLAGRTIDVSLDPRGQRQAEALAEYFASAGLSTIQSSPRERAVQTARPIADRLGLEFETVPAVDEIDCGAWSGCSFDDLSCEPSWQHWNRSRSSARPPGGESMQDVQRRIIGHFNHVHAVQERGRVLIVSHSDVIRAAILHYLGMSLDCYGQIEIDPAAVSTLLVGGRGSRIISLNRAVST